MTYRGHIKNGVAVINTAIALPDGTPVRVEIESTNSEFHQDRSVDDLAREQGVKPLSTLNDLTIDWPQEDSIDELRALVREVRH